MPSTIAPSAPRLLTLKAVAAELSISRRSVDGLISSTHGRPRLRTVRMGGMVRVAREDLDAYVSTLRQEAGHAPIKRSA